MAKLLETSDEEYLDILANSKEEAVNWIKKHTNKKYEYKETSAKRSKYNSMGIYVFKLR